MVKFIKNDSTGSLDADLMNEEENSEEDLHKFIKENLKQKVNVFNKRIKYINEEIRKAVYESKRNKYILNQENTTDTVIELEADFIST